MRHRLSSNASRDLVQLYRQSLFGFGMAHADRYLGQLQSAFLSIAEYPSASPERADLRGARLKPFGVHHILYRVRAGEVIILRVLHGRQDIARYAKS